MDHLHRPIGPAMTPTLPPYPSTRAGEYVLQPGNYRAFLPAPLPPMPPLQIDDELTRLLSDADRAVGRLDGIASVLPNPDLFVATVSYTHLTLPTSDLV